MIIQKIINHNNMVFPNNKHHRVLNQSHKGNLLLQTGDYIMDVKVPTVHSLKKNKPKI